MAAPTKSYGLFIPKQKKALEKLKPANVFGDDDEEVGKEAVKTTLRKESKKVKRQTQLDIDKALAEDPTVFDYDNVYDDMQGKKKEETKKKSTKVESKPRYIEQLLKAGEKRKKENERRLERKVQKEREAEGDEFQDKEVFVTSAYKKKMLEQQEEEERERQEAEMEAKLDVTKQKDMTGFYRYILNETTKEETDVKEEPVTVKRESEDKKGEPKHDDSAEQQPKERPKPSRSHSKSPEKQTVNEKKKIASTSSETQDNLQPDLDNKSPQGQSKSVRARSQESSKSKGKRRRRPHSSSSERDSDSVSDVSEPDKHSKDGDKDDGDQPRTAPKNPLQEIEVSNSWEATASVPTDKTAETVVKSKYARRSTQADILQARKRYLARKLAREQASL